MSTITNDNDNPEIELDDSTPQNLRAYIRKLEKENRDGKSRDGENAKLKSQLALTEAGLKDLNEDQREALLAAVKGETTPEAFRKKAEALKFVDPAPENADTDQAAHKQIADAQTGGSGPKGDLDYEQAMRGANSREEVAALAQKYGKPIVDQ